MNWACDLSVDAENDLRELPTKIKRRVTPVLNQMASTPFVGNIKALQGAEWRGVFRRRIGDYRILFVPIEKHKTITIIAILPRSKETYL